MFCSREYQHTSILLQQNEKSTPNYYFVPVSIKQKSTLNTTRAKKIIRKVEKNLIQARIKSINNILNNVAQQIEQCRSQLASIISTERLRECQGFIDKVGETRFNKVKLRQIKKFQNLVNKKEGNITWYSNNNSNNNLPQAGNNPNRHAGTPIPPGKAVTPPGKTSPSYSGRRRSKLPQTGLVSPSQAIAHLPSQEDSNSQAIAHLPSQESSNSLLATALLPPSKGSSLTPAIAHLPSQEGSNSLPAIALPPPSEGSSLTPAITHLPSQEGSNSLPATAHLPPREGSISPIASGPSQAILPPREGSNSTTALPPSREGDNPPKQVNLIIKIGQSGKVSGILTGTGQPRLPRRTALSPRKTIPPLPHPLAPPRDLPMKIPTLIGSLTSPANP